MTSPHSVTVPGAPDAWKNIHNDFGKLDFEELFLAAIDFAKNGFRVTRVVANAWNKNLDKLLQDKNSKSVFFSGPPKIFAFWVWRRSDSAFSRYLVILGHSPKARLRRENICSREVETFTTIQNFSEIQ